MGEAKDVAEFLASEGLAGSRVSKLVALSTLPRSKAEKRASKDELGRLVLASGELLDCAASFRCHSCRLGGGESTVRRWMPGSFGVEPLVPGALLPRLKLLLSFSGGDL